MQPRIDLNTKTEQEQEVEQEVQVLDKGSDVTTNFSSEIMKALTKTQSRQEKDDIVVINDEIKTVSLEENVVQRQVNSSEYAEKPKNKLVFIKCKVCQHKIRKDMFEDHKTENHPDFAELTAGMRNESASSPSNRKTSRPENSTQLEKPAKHSKTDHVSSTIGHLNTHCRLCRKYFNTVLEFDNHKNQIHKDEMHFFDLEVIKDSDLTQVCKICLEGFLSMDILNFHYLDQHNKKVETCKLCYMRLYSQQTIKRHKTEYHKNDAHLLSRDVVKFDLKFKCSQCDKCFASLELVAFHKKYTHSNNSPMGRLLQPKTSKSTKERPKQKNTALLAIKMESSAKPSDNTEYNEIPFDNSLRPFRCKLCDMSWINNWKLTRHMMQVHKIRNKMDGTKKKVKKESAEEESSDNSTETICLRCGKNCSSKWNMRRHMIKFHKMKREELPFEIPYSMNKL